jgi:hypothetical protein
MMERLIKELPDEEMTIISITRANRYLLKWREENKEFIYKGKLYDLASTRISGDTIIYYCINDKQEEELFANLDDHMQRNISSDIPLNKKINNLIEKLIKEYIKNDYSLNIFNNGKEIFFYYSGVNFNLVYLKITTPPPKPIYI